MKTSRWFLPEQPDMLGLLQRQIGVTREGVDVLVEWARGDLTKAERVRELEHVGDEHKRELEIALKTAFTTPLEPEDLYTLSRGIDWILNYSKDLVRESEVMDAPPDDALLEMCECLAASVHILAEAIDGLAAGAPRTTELANDALKSVRQVEKIYREAMARLVAVDDL
ncbi:MAG TPA: DUF47 family protein, partial [Gaiellaceae bacterium]|nr:DUF47 family protein [Gaiellaceae bacterium]